MYPGMERRREEEEEEGVFLLACRVRLQFITSRQEMKRRLAASCREEVGTASSASLSPLLLLSLSLSLAV